MPTIHGRKAINFDLNDNLLKKYYPSKSHKNAWRDIKKYLINNQFCTSPVFGVCIDKQYEHGRSRKYNWKNG